MRAPDELEATGLPGAGVGGILEERRAMSYRDEGLPASVESWVSTTSGFLVAPDFDVAERVAGARCRVPSVSVSVGLMSSDGKARMPSCVTTSPTSSLWSSPRLFAGAPSKIVRRASRMGLSCSLQVSTCTPRGYADRLWVVCTTEYVAIDQSSDRVDRNLLLPHPVRQVGATASGGVCGHVQRAH